MSIEGDVWFPQGSYEVARTTTSSLQPQFRALLLLMCRPARPYPTPSVGRIGSVRPIRCRNLPSDRPADQQLSGARGGGGFHDSAPREHRYPHQQSRAVAAVTGSQLQRAARGDLCTGAIIDFAAGASPVGDCGAISILVVGDGRKRQGDACNAWLAVEQGVENDADYLQHVMAIALIMKNRALIE